MFYHARIVKQGIVNQACTHSRWIVLFRCSVLLTVPLLLYISSIQYNKSIFKSTIKKLKIQIFFKFLIYFFHFVSFSFYYLWYFFFKVIILFKSLIFSAVEDITSLLTLISPSLSLFENHLL